MIDTIVDNPEEFAQSFRQNGSYQDDPHRLVHPRVVA